jgi:hypothetical protein
VPALARQASLDNPSMIFGCACIFARMTLLIAVPTGRDDVGSYSATSISTRHQMLGGALKDPGLSQSDGAPGREEEGVVCPHRHATVITVAALPMEGGRSIALKGLAHWAPLL